jgi:hypothetical protein
MDIKVIVKYTLIGLGVSLAALLVFGIPTSLIPNPIFSRMIPSLPLDYVFLIITSLLVGAYAALHFYGKQAAPFKKAEKATAYSGLLGSIVAFGCPLCNKVFVMALGSSTILNYIEPYRPIIGTVGAAAMGLAVFVKGKTVRDGACLLPEKDSEQENE